MLLICSWIVNSSPKRFVFCTLQINVLLLLLLFSSIFFSRSWWLAQERILCQIQPQLQSYILFKICFSSVFDLNLNLLRYHLLIYISRFLFTIRPSDLSIWSCFFFFLSMNCFRSLNLGILKVCLASLEYSWECLASL